MAEWIFVFMFLGKTPAPGDIHATGMKMTREECVDLIKHTPGPVACINAKHPIRRIYRKDVEGKEAKP